MGICMPEYFWYNKENVEESMPEEERDFLSRQRVEYYDKKFEDMKPSSEFIKKFS